jgi:hypothetical protein
MNSTPMTSQHLERMVRGRYPSVTQPKLVQNSTVHNNPVPFVNVLDMWGGGGHAVRERLLHSLKGLGLNGIWKCKLCGRSHSVWKTEHCHAGFGRYEAFLTKTNCTHGSWENLSCNIRNIEVPVTKANHCKKAEYSRFPQQNLRLITRLA